MTRIAKAFENKKAFIAFVTGGDPDIETTEKLIPKMAEAGADLIEIGIPFSDPIAEGVVIQEADVRALKAGTTTDSLFDMVKRVRTKTDIPLVFMTYMNPVYTYGTERFMKKCAECGIDGVIIPDVPFEEKDEVSGACNEAGIDLISMIAPTSKERKDHAEYFMLPLMLNYPTILSQSFSLTLWLSVTKISSMGSGAMVLLISSLKLFSRVIRQTIISASSTITRIMEYVNIGL